MSLIQCPECEARVDTAARSGSTLRCASCGAEIGAEASEPSRPIQADAKASKRIPEGPVPEGRARSSARIGHYRLIQGLGRGSFGEVWKAAR